MNKEEIRVGMRVRNAFQPNLTGTVQRIDGGEFQRKLRMEAAVCEDCKCIPGNFWADMYPPIPSLTCHRHSGAEAGERVMVEWDTRKGSLIACAPNVLEPEIDLRLN